MRKKFLLVLFLSTAILAGCENFSKRKDDADNPNACTQYSCPMHPDKTGTAPAQCPVCSMPMEPVTKNTKNDSAKSINDIK